MNVTHQVEESFMIWKNKSTKAKGGYLRSRSVIAGWAANCSCGAQIVTNMNSTNRHAKQIAKHITVGA